MLPSLGSSVVLSDDDWWFSCWWCVDVLVLGASCCFQLLSVDSTVRVCLCSNLPPIRFHQFTGRSDPFTNLHFRPFRVHPGPQIRCTDVLGRLVGGFYYYFWLLPHSFQWLHLHILWLALSASCPTLHTMLFFLFPTNPMSFKNSSRFSFKILRSLNSRYLIINFFFWGGGAGVKLNMPIWAIFSILFYRGLKVGNFKYPL